MSAPTPHINPAFGTGLHAHLTQARVRRFQLRFNHDRFVTARTAAVPEAKAPMPLAA